MTGQVLAALITTGGVIVAAVLALVGNIWKLRRENRAQHDDNKQSMTEAMGELGGKVDVMHADVRHVAERLDEHMRNHAPTLDAQVIQHPKHNTGGSAA
jgi:uncharacterized protein (DUF2235 family)